MLHVALLIGSSVLGVLHIDLSVGIPVKCKESEEKDEESSTFIVAGEFGGMHSDNFLIKSVVIFFNSLAQASISATSSAGHPAGA